MVTVNPFGAVFIVVGLLGAIWPYRVARFREALDAIGSTRKMSEVEPAGWMVTLTRVGSIVAFLIGVVVLLGLVSV